MPSFKLKSCNRVETYRHFGGRCLGYHASTQKIHVEFAAVVNFNQTEDYNPEECCSLSPL